MKYFSSVRFVAGPEHTRYGATKTILLLGEPSAESGLPGPFVGEVLLHVAQIEDKGWLYSPMIRTFAWGSGHLYSTAL